MKNEYLEWKKTYTQRAWHEYRTWIERLHEFCGDDMEKITINMISKFLDIMKERYAPKNIEYAMNIIHNYFAFCRDRGMNCLPPGLIKVPRCRGAIRRHTTEEIYQRLIDRLPLNEWIPLRNSIIIRILHDTGCRLSEVLAIDFKNLDDNSALVPTRKTKEFRTIYWSDETHKILWEKYIPIRICLDYQGDAIFVSKYGEQAKGRLTTRTFQRSFKSLCREVGIEGISAHSFRHGKAHRMLEQNASIGDIAQILGHRNIQSSMKYLSLSTFEIGRLAKKYL